MQEDPQIVAASIVILLFSVIVHEVMHGLAAKKFGDHTAENAGRLTLNPIPHIDLFGTIILPGLLILSGSPILFGWAKPVPVNPLNFSNIQKGEFFVSAAGIAANLVLAAISALLFHITLPQIFYFAVHINLLLAVFNLMPIPPLDGSKVLMSFLPYNLARNFEKLTPYGPIILVALLYSGVLGTLFNLIITPVELLVLRP